MKLATLDNLFEHELKDLLSAEKQLVKALPKMAKAATSKKLRSGFDAGIYRPQVISKSLPLAEAQQAYELVANGERGRVVLKPR